MGRSLWVACFVSIAASIGHSMSRIMGSVAVLVGCCGSVAADLLYCSVAVVVGCCTLVTIGRSLCRSVAVSRSLWVDCYESVTDS